MTNTVVQPLPNPLGSAPLRRAYSIRRTTNIDMTWPNGMLGHMGFDATGRDIYTAENVTEYSVLQHDKLQSTVSPRRYITAISATPSLENIGQLVGERGGGHLRSALDVLFKDNKLASLRPLYLLIDDISGASLIAPWAWSKWPNLEPEQGFSADTIRQMRQKMAGVCVGFSPGFSALQATTDLSEHLSERRSAKVIALPHPEDNAGWHPLAEHHTISMRRARRIDVWLEGDIYIDTMFQDSASLPEGGREAVHEYHLKVSANTDTGMIKSIQVTPHILPFLECPYAVNKVHLLKDTPLCDLRHTVLERLRKTNGCTHLNDALRSLAEVPLLVEQLKARI